MTRGRFIALEGWDGSGKTTQSRLLATTIGAVHTREPGGTAIGRRIRSVVLEPTGDPVSERAEVLLFTADRAQHVDEVVEPALVAGRDVVSDRSYASSLAYQGYGRGLDIEELQRLTFWATRGILPDLIVYLDVPVNTARGRLADALDRLEAEGDDFHKRVLHGFTSLAEAEPERWVIVDGDGTIDEVASLVAAAVHSRLPRP